MTSKLDSTLSFQQQALGLRTYRQQILAGNIANADTPNYKARDFDFAAALREAQAGQAAGNVAMSRTAANHLPGAGDAAPAAARLMYRIPAQASVDGNTVEMDAERAQFSENAIQYEAGLAFVTHLLKLQMSAIQA